MNVLFIGATGLVGRQIVPLLKPQYDLTPVALGGGEIDGLAVEDLDITRWEPVEALAARGTARGEPFDAVVNCAIADYHGVRHEDPENRRDYYQRCIEVNARGAYHVFEAAARAGVPRVVYISSLSIMGGQLREGTIAADAREQPYDVYAAAKLFGEHVGRSYVFPRRGESNMSVICLRLGGPYPAFSDFDRQVFEQPRMRGLASHVRDVARAVDAALQTGVRFGAYPILSVSDVPYMDTSRCAEIDYSPAWRFTAEGVLPIEQ